MAKTLPVRPNLAHLKAQAKDLLSAYRAGDAAATARVRPFFEPLPVPRLHHAQLIIAREYGFDSWAKLKHHVELRTDELTRRADADRLAALAMQGDVDAVRARFQEAPDLKTATLAAACATGSLDAVRGFIDADPSLTRAKIGEKRWEPLLYVCFSCLLKDPDYRLRLVETAHYLLENAADTNAHFPNPDWNNTPEPCLYGATGVHDCAELAALLLNAGANPNDNESLYHSMELPTWDCLKLLLDHGAQVAHGNALMHLLDREEPDWLRMFLQRAGHPDQIPPVLPHALRRGRSAETFQILLQFGIATDTKDENGLTPYQSATRLGRADVAELLAGAGADATLSPVDKLLSRLASGETVAPETIPRDIIALLDAEPAPELVRHAESGNTTVVEILLAAGANPNVRDSQCTPLHQACLHGHVSAVQALLKHGADPPLCDTVHHGDALVWATFGANHTRTAPPEAYAAILDALTR